MKNILMAEMNASWVVVCKNEITLYSSARGNICVLKQHKDRNMYRSVERPRPSHNEVCPDSGHYDYHDRMDSH